MKRLITDILTSLKSVEKYKSIETGLFGTSKVLSTEDVASLKNYNELLKQGKSSTEAFDIALGNSNDTVKQMAINASGSVVELQSMTLAERAAAAGAKLLGGALKIATGFLIGIAINGVINWIDDLVHSEEKAKEKLEELYSQSKETTQKNLDEVKSLQENLSTYQELSKKVSLTAEDKKTLLSIQNDLIDKYGIEAKNIDFLTGKYKENNAELEKIIANKAKDALTSAKTEYSTAKSSANSIKNGEKLYSFKENAEDFNNMSGIIDRYANIIQESTNKITTKTKSAVMMGFGQLFPWGNVGDDGTISLQENLSLKDQINAIQNILDGLNKNTTVSERQEQKYIDLTTNLNEKLKERQEILDKINEALSDVAKTQIAVYQAENPIDTANITETQYNEWKDNLLSQFEDDNDLKSAIQSQLETTFSDLELKFEVKKEDKTPSFDITQFSEDIDNLQTKIKSLKETLSKLKDGSITQDELIDFTQEYGLTEYINDIPKLQSEIEKLIQTSPDELINKLWELRKSLSDVDKAKVDNLITTLEQLSDIESVSDITNEINTLDDQINGLKDTIDGLDDQIKSIDEQLSNLKDRQSDLQDENSGMQQALEYLIEQNIRAIENQIEPHQKVVDKIEEENDKLEQQNDLYQEQLDLLNEKIGKYETAADVVKDAIQQEIDILNDRKQTVEDEYQTRIDKIQQENDAINEQLELEKKKDAYENAKRRKKLVYTGAAGLQLVTDQTAVDETKKDYNDALASKKISDLEKERDIKINTIEKQIKSWEDYSQRWSDVVDNINKKQDEKTAKEILGSNWRKKINQQDISVLQTFASKYNFYVNVQKVALEKKIQQNEKDIKQNEKIIKSEQKVISEKQKIIEKWNDYKTELSNAISDIEGSNNKYISSLKNLVNGENLTLQNRNKYLSNFKAVYAKNIADINSITNSIKSLENTKTNLENSKTVAQDKKTSLEDKKKELETRANESDTIAKRVKYYIVKNKKGRTIQAFQNKKAAQVFIKDTIKESISDKVSADMAKLPTGLPADIVQNERVQSRKKWEKYYKNYYKVVPKYKTGGVADYTGMAQLDGSKSKSEVIFNSTDAKKLYDLVHNTTNLADMLSKRIVDTMQSGSNLDRNIQTNSSTVTPINIVIEKVVADNPVEFAKQMQAQIEYAFKQMNLDRMIGKIKK